MSAALLKPLDPAEGWMAVKPTGTNRYHFIRAGMALCGGYGLYRAELIPHVPGNPKGNEDCAKCFRLAPTRMPRLVLDLLRKLIADDKRSFSRQNERAIVDELIDRAEEAEAVTRALLGAMPPALQKKWPNICERANRVVGGGA